MAKWMNLKINNSKDASVKTGKWKDPGASLYDQLLNAGYFPSDNVDDPNNLGTHHYLKETYLVAPVDKIKCGPYGQTPYSRSGCKYPHHIIRKGELIVHQAGLKAAYSRAKQMGIFSGDVKEHLERHYKELDMYEGSTMAMSETIQNNFEDIESYILESTGIDLHSPTNVFDERSHGNLKSSFEEVLIESNNNISINMNKFISEKDIYVNFDKWENGEKLVLFVTGISGSGKSTLARKIAKKYNADYIDLDKFRGNAHYSDSELKEIQPILFKYLSDNFKDRTSISSLSSDEYHKEFDKYMHWLINSGLKVILEGVQAAQFIYENKAFKDYPIIFKGTSKYASLIRRIKRDGLKVTFNNVIKTLSLYNRWENEQNIARQITITKDNNFEMSEESADIYQEAVECMNDINQFMFETSQGINHLWIDNTKKLPPIYQKLLNDTNDLIIKTMEEKIKSDNKYERLNDKDIIKEIKDSMLGPSMGCVSLTKRPNSCECRMYITGANQDYEFYHTDRDKYAIDEVYKPIYSIYYDMMKDIEKELKPNFKKHKKVGIEFMLRGDPIDQIHEFEFDLDRKASEELWNYLQDKSHSKTFETKLFKESFSNTNIPEYLKDDPAYIAKSRHAGVPGNNQITFDQLVKIWDGWGIMGNGPSRKDNERCIGIFGENDDDYLQEGKLADGMKHLYKKIIQFLRWLFGSKKSLYNDQILSHPEIMNAPRLPFTIIGTPIVIGPNSKYHEGFDSNIIESYNMTPFNESIKDDIIVDGNIKQKIFGLNKSELIKVLTEFGQKYKVSMAIDVGRVTREIAFVQDKEMFMLKYGYYVKNKDILILYEDDTYPDIMCVSTKSFYRRIPVNEVKWTLAHEYGHILTTDKISNDDRLETKLKLVLLRSFKNHGKEIHYVRSYYQIPIEKMANDAVGINSEKDIAILSGYNNPALASGWENSVFGRIVNLKIPDDILSLTYLTIHNLSVDNLKSAIKYSIETYPKLLPANEATEIVRYLKSLDPKKVLDYEKGNSDKHINNIKTNLKEGFNMDDDLDWIEKYLTEEATEDPAPPAEESKKSPEPAKQEPEKKPEPEKKESMPQKTDKAESDKNGVRRKKLYIAFIEWAKAINPKNTFGSIFDKDAFHSTYPFVPEEMRYFYRLANPMLCVLTGDLTFFAVAELKKLNIKNSRLSEMMIFAATKTDVRVFNKKDKKVYRGVEENGMLKLAETLGDNFDHYIQKMINKGDILNAPLQESADLLSADQGERQMIF